MNRERRRHKRYATQATVYFSVAYAVDARMKFQVKDTAGYDRHPAEARDISLEGFSFTSDQRLEKDAIIMLEICLAGRPQPIHMEAEVRWSQRIYSEKKFEDKFNTGVRVLSVEGKSVADSIQYDEAHRVAWSPVLDAVFGNYRTLVQREHTEGESAAEGCGDQKFCCVCGE